MSSVFNCLYDKLSKNNRLIIFLNNLNNMGNNFVVIGHYRNNADTEPIDGSIPSVDILRVLGPDPKKEGFWICDGGISRRETYILENYSLIPTEEQKKPIKNHLFKDFENLKNPEIIHTNYDNIPQNIEVSNVQQINKYTNPVIINPINVDIEIIEKLNIETYNKYIFDKYGDSSQFKKVRNIKLEFSVPFMYDIVNLRNTIKMLNLDEKEISNYLTEKVLESVDIKSLLSMEIRNMLTDINYDLNQSEVIIPEVIIPEVIIPEVVKEPEIIIPEVVKEPEVIIPEVVTENSKKLNEGLLTISKYLSNYIKN